MQHEVDVVQVLEPQQLGEVVDVRVDADVARHLVAAVALAGERRREHGVPGRAQRLAHLAPTPRAVHRTVHQHEGRHVPATLDVRTMTTW